MDIFKTEEDIVKKMFEEISVIPKKYAGNQRCHHNCRNALEMHECNRIAEVIMFVDKRAILHFVEVIDNKGKMSYLGTTYHETTLGYYANYSNYYIVKEYERVDLLGVDMDKLFIKELKKLNKSTFNWFQRNILRMVIH